MAGSDVNKDLTLKAKAKAKDSTFKAKAKAKDSAFKAKAKAKDLTFKATGRYVKQRDSSLTRVTPERCRDEFSLLHSAIQMCCLLMFVTNYNLKR